MSAGPPTAHPPPDPQELANFLKAFPLLWFSSLENVPHQEQLVKGLLLAESLFVVFGESNSGKTFWILDLALAIAAGAHWRGRRTKRGLVIYVAGEGAASIRARIGAYRKNNPEASGGLPFAVVAHTVNFLSTESVDSLIATIKFAESEMGEKVVLVIIDTFARAIPGGNENDAADVGLAIAAADRVRTEAGACVGFIHHAGKDPTKGARGSSALRAATDTEILIEGVTGTRTATVTKQRDLETGEPMPFDLVPVQIGTDPDDNQPVTSCVIKQLRPSEAPKREPNGKNVQDALAALRRLPSNEFTMKQAQEAIRPTLRDRRRVHEAITWLQQNRWLTPTVGGLRLEA